VNHTRFQKEDHLPNWARRDYKVTKDDRAEGMKRIGYCIIQFAQTNWQVQKMGLVYATKYNTE